MPITAEYSADKIFYLHEAELLQLSLYASISLMTQNKRFKIVTMESLHLVL